MLGFFGTGMMVKHLKHWGTYHSTSDLLKMFVKMGASWTAQVLRQAGDTLSGPGAFLFGGNMVVIIWFSPILLHLGQDWAKIPTSHCAGLISNYKKCLAAVIAAKEGRTRYWKQRFTCFCDAQICNTGLFFSINIWPLIHFYLFFCLICLIGFSLFTFRTRVLKSDVFLGHIYTEI